MINRSRFPAFNQWNNGFIKYKISQRSKKATTTDPHIQPLTHSFNLSIPQVTIVIKRLKRFQNLNFPHPTHEHLNFILVLISSPQKEKAGMFHELEIFA
jgi:hypothetical protein